MPTLLLHIDASCVRKEVMPMSRKIGRDARNGQFIPVKVAERRKATAVVETIKTEKGKGKKGK